MTLGAPVSARTTSMWVTISLVIVTSAGTVLQARINGELLGYVHNAAEVSLLNLGSALVAMLIMLLLSSTLRRGVRRALGALRDGQLKWWHLLGGLVGAAFVATQAAAVPVIGVAVFTVAVVAGQTANSVVIDRLGIGPAGVQLITPNRIVAGVLAIVAVAVSVSDRLSPAGGSSTPVVAMTLLSLAIGAIGVFQSALNGQVARAGGYGLVGAFANFAFGTLALGAVVGGLWWLTDVDPRALPFDRPWLFIGGVLGLAYVATIATAVGTLGVLRSGLASVLGLLAGALILDLVAPSAGTTVGWHLIAGIVLAFVAVTVSLSRR